ncbi:MAG: MFS transporter [Clostridiaceae bacterium]|jgi:sugar (glycoside-pentoside-hexuronide) transporter|nr:MFS transporter [Clostridiaceae bacterium]
MSIGGDNLDNITSSRVTTKRERRDYGLFFIGQNMFYLFVMNFIQNYFTDVVGMAAGTVAIIILIARLWDAVNDPIFGGIVDRSRLKGGRFKPWLKLSLCILPIFTIGLFAVPSGLALPIKTAICAIVYFVWGMAFTVCDVPIYSLSTAMTNNMQERTALIARGRLNSTFGIMAVILATVPLTGLFSRLIGNESQAWLIVAVIFSVIAFFFMRPIAKSATERFIDQSTKALSIKGIFSYLKSNKYLLIFYSAMIIFSLTNTVSTLSLYFATVNLGDKNMFIVVTLITMIGAPFVSIFLPKLNKKFDKFQIFMFGMAVAIVTSVIIYFVGYEGVRFVPFLILSFIRGVGFSCTMVMSYMFAADCIEYGTYKSGKRAEGITFSIQTFTTKMTGAISGFIAMGLLGWFFNYQSAYYVDNVLISPVQPQSAVTGIWFMYSIFPAIGAIIAFIILILLYKLRDNDVQIMANVNSGEITVEEGERLLNEKHGGDVKSESSEEGERPLNEEHDGEEEGSSNEEHDEDNKNKPVE